MNSMLSGGYGFSDDIRVRPNGKCPKIFRTNYWSVRTGFGQCPSEKFNDSKCVKVRMDGQCPNVRKNEFRTDVHPFVRPKFVRLKRLQMTVSRNNTLGFIYAHMKPKKSQNSFSINTCFHTLFFIDFFFFI